MNFSKKNHELVRQNEKNVKKSQKHDVNLQKNSTLYFQIGLILCLLATYFLMDMKFLTSDYTFDPPPLDIDVAEVYNLDYKIYEERVKQVEKKVERKKVILNDNVLEVPDDFKEVEPLPEVLTENTTNSPMNPDGVIDVIDPPIDDVVIFKLVEVAPIFPGCEKLSTNDERKACMSEKISRLVQRKFNTNIGEELGLSGEHTIHVQFKIDKTGNVADIQTSAKQSQLDREAKRVIGKIPTMEPGKQKDENVSVMYTLPITFRVFN